MVIRVIELTGKQSAIIDHPARSLYWY